MSLYCGKASTWPSTVHKNRCSSYSINQILETLAQMITQTVLKIELIVDNTAN